MKKMVTAIMALAMAFCIAGCNLNNSQIKAACGVAGSGAALGWVALENPTDAQKTQVSDVLTVVQSAITGVGTNTYVEVIYPLAQQYVNANPKIKPSEKVAILTGVLAVLSGIDIMFDSYPEWKQDTTNVESYVNSFLGGANSILLLPASHPKFASAKANYKISAGLKQTK